MSGYISGILGMNIHVYLFLFTNLLLLLCTDWRGLLERGIGIKHHFLPLDQIFEIKQSGKESQKEYQEGSEGYGCLCPNQGNLNGLCDVGVWQSDCKVRACL